MFCLLGWLRCGLGFIALLNSVVLCTITFGCFGCYIVCFSVDFAVLLFVFYLSSYLVGVFAVDVWF